MIDTLLAHWPLVTIVGVVLFALQLGRLLLPEERPPYEKRPSLVTDAERRFYQVLTDVVETRWKVFPMVRLADVIQVRSHAPQSQTWRNKILAKHLDFVLCDPETLEARLAVELDDATHQRPDRAERDAFLESALHACHLPLLRVAVAEGYDRDALRKSIEQLAV